MDLAAWRAIDLHRGRLEAAVHRDDRPLAVGSAKELVESIARVVLESTGENLGEAADFPKVVDTAQNQLGMRPADLAGQPEVRAVAQSASKMIKSVNEVRNDLGTGHGKSSVPDPGLSEPTISAVVDAGLLWARWALLILGSVLASQPGVLIETVRGPATRPALRKALNEFDLSKQLPAAQRQVAVVFGQRAAGGFGNAHFIGIAPAAASSDLTAWPPEYRLGLIDGLLINSLGQITLADWFAGDIPDLLIPISTSDAASRRLAELVTKVEEAQWEPSRRDNLEDRTSSVETLRSGASNLVKPVRGHVDRLCSLLET